MVFLLNSLVIQNPKFRVHTGLFDHEPMPPEVEKLVAENKNEKNTDENSAKDEKAPSGETDTETEKNENERNEENG